MPTIYTGSGHATPRAFLPQHNVAKDILCDMMLSTVSRHPEFKTTVPQKNKEHLFGAPFEIFLRISFSVMLPHHMRCTAIAFVLE